MSQVQSGNVPTPVVAPTFSPASPGFGVGFVDYLSNALESVTKGYDKVIKQLNQGVSTAGSTVSPLAKSVGDFGGTLSNLGNLVSIFRPDVGMKMSATGEVLKGAPVAVDKTVQDAQKAISGYARTPASAKASQPKQTKKKKRKLRTTRPKTRRTTKYTRR